MRIDTKLYKKILNHARGSFSRMNASSAKFYSFTCIGSSWQGGWSWGNLYGEKHLLDIESGELLK